MRLLTKVEILRFLREKINYDKDFKMERLYFHILMQ